MGLVPPAEEKAVTGCLPVERMRLVPPLQGEAVTDCLPVERVLLVSPLQGEVMTGCLPPVERVGIHHPVERQDVTIAVL